MDFLRARPAPTDYQSIPTSTEDEPDQASPDTNRYSRTDYFIFMLLGLATLWPFNMYLNAGPYLSHRFASHQWTKDNFQAAEISVSSIVNLVTIVVFTQRQAHASYPLRIIAALINSAVAFVLLAASTWIFLDVSVSAYFAFLILMVSITSFGTGLIQNGSFAYAASYGQPTYMQSIMVGQAIAGVLPSIVQISIALGLGRKDTGPEDVDTSISAAQLKSNDALAFFLAASVVAVVALIASLHLFNRRPPSPENSKTVRAGSSDSQSNLEPPAGVQVSMLVLARKLCYLALAVAICFAITMASFPIYTQQITSLDPDGWRFGSAKVFIPLAFLFWNSGDLLGRITTAWPTLIPHQRPQLVLGLSVGRALLIPVYTMCNIRGRGASVSSDAFYLIFQLIFGFTNGYVGSLCMMSTSDHVEPKEAGAAGSFMGVCLILGLSIGSLLSFAFTA